jgi:putative DNA primase/helicase
MLKSTSSKNFSFLFRRDGIYVLDDGNSNRRRIADPIMVIAFATSDGRTNLEEAFVEMKFMDRRGKWKKEIVPASMLAGEPTEFIKLLSGLGYLWPKHWKREIVSELSVVRPKRNVLVTSVPGWHGKVFVLPGESYGPKGASRRRLKIVRKPTVKLGEFRRSGTLEEWQKKVARKCVHSTRARLAIAAVFAAPNLRPLGLSSFGINFSGHSSGGKTLLLRLAASTCGLNGDGGPATWDGTPVGFEQRTLGHRDCIMPLDDVGFLEGDPKAAVKYVTFRFAGNRGKERAGQYAVAQNLVDADHRSIALSTSEDPLWAHLGKGHSRPIRGEEVRMLDVPALISDMKDIFDGPNAATAVGKTVEQRGEYVDELARNAQEYQGEAFRAYLVQRTADKNAEATLRKYMGEFAAEAPLPAQRRWLGRIRQYYAICYASAAQAIDYGILPWSKKATLRAIRACMYDAMAQLIAATEPGAQQPSDESLLAQFKSRVDGATFAQLNANRRKKSTSRMDLKNADGIVRPTKPGKVEYFLFSRTMDRWFPENSDRRRLTKLLRSRRIFRSGRRPDTSTQQVKIANLGRIPCYGLRRKRLRD